MLLSRKDQLNIAGALWSWQPCERCRSGKSCASLESCPASRLSRLGAYFKAVSGSLSRLDLETDGRGTATLLKDGISLARICHELRSRTALARHEALRAVFDSATDLDSEPAGSNVEKEQTLDALVKLMFMVDCSGQSLDSIQDLEGAGFRHAWRSKTTMSQFFTGAFPINDHPGVTKIGTAIVADLGARKLMQRAGLSFAPTNDLRNHLRLDRSTGQVEIFHHAGFLKEHLRLTFGAASEGEISECLAEGSLPRQLLLETLDSVQKVLFRIDQVNDTKSEQLLQSLVSSKGFDPECLRYEAASIHSIRRSDEKTVSYCYWGARLADLHQEMLDPTPRGLVDTWLDRRSGNRYLMLATLIGVIFAVLIGLCSLGVDAYQAYLGYQQWQHPVAC